QVPFVVLPTPRFSSRVRAFAFLFHAWFWKSHYASPLPNAFALSVRAVHPLFDWISAFRYLKLSRPSALSARMWLSICRDSNRNRRGRRSVYPCGSHLLLRAERWWRWRGENA